MTAIEIDAATLRQKQVELIYARGQAYAFLGIGAALLALAASFGTLSTTVLGAWIVVTAAIYAALIGVVRAHSRSAIDPAAAAGWLSRYLVPVVLVGLAWGALGALVVQSGDTYRIVAVLFIAGCLAASTVPIYLGYLPVVVGYTAPALLPPALMLLVNAAPPMRLAGALALALVVIVFALSSQVRRYLHALLSAYNEISQHVSHLDTRREQVEKLSVALKTTQDKKDQAELALRRTSADLGLAKGKAKALSDTLERVSPYCPVTGLYNRRCFDETLRVEWRRATRDKKPLSLVMLQLDDFDVFQTTYGAQATEALLKRVAKVLKQFGRRGGDLIARFSDSRFGLLLAGCDTKNAFRIAEAVREKLMSLHVPHEKSRVAEFVTGHLGVATIVPARGMDDRTLVERVEAAAYEASFQGGNRTVLYRALDKLRLEHWNLKADGPLNEQALQQKILIWGYETKRGVHPAGTRFPDRNHDTEVMQSVLTGQLKVTIEGQSLLLKHGDCLFIPAGLTYSAEVPGTDPAICFEAHAAD